MAKKQKVLKVKETNIHLVTKDELDYISLTGMLKPFVEDSITQNWMQYRETKKRIFCFLTFFVLNSSEII